jgi:Holliday junction resolvase RusA-like endonuclease
MQARAAVPAELQPLDEPLEVSAVFYFPRPKRLGKRQDNPPHTVVPDKDNVEKAMLDALKSAGVIRNDSLVWSGATAKVYCEYGGTPRAEIVIRTTNDA